MMRDGCRTLAVLAVLAEPARATPSPSSSAPVRLEVDAQGDATWMLVGPRLGEKTLTDSEAKTKLRELVDKFRKVVCDLPELPSTATMDMGFAAVTWQGKDLCAAKP